MAVGLGFVLALPMLFVDWRGGDEYPRLEKGVRVVRYMSAARQLKRSSFLAVYPEGKPSEFVSWMFSDLGAAEWPPSEMEMEELRGEGARAIGLPVIPREVGIFSRLRKDHSRQIIVQADDARGLILVQGYLSPRDPPVFTRKWPFKLPQSGANF
ncbi:MAG: hypothetical protein GWO19_02815 [Nitrospinaceae bacterium]|nr:hypothetical protein [Nitrospinaceae bacterium]